MSQHTPGPWIVTGEEREGERPHLCVETAKGGIIANIHGGCHYPTRPTILQNARLIAAAPELLEALHAAENIIVELLEIVGGDADLGHNVLPQVRAVIAKAEGGR